MRTLDRLLLAAVTGGLAVVVWRVEQLRGEVTDKRIDSAALALQAWGRTDGATAVTQVLENHGDATDMRDLAATVRRARKSGGGA